MTRKSTYEELEQRVRELEMESAERKRAEEALLESEAFRSNLLEFSPTPILVFNPDTSIIYVNPEFEKLTGYTSEELLGKKAPFPWWMEKQGSGDILELKRNIPKGVQGVERVFCRKNGDIFWVEITSTPIRRNDELRYTLITWVDITERKRAEAALARLNRQNELILCSAAEGILGLDLQGNHTFVNPAAARMMGYEVKELLGRPSHSAWHHTKPDGSPYPREECAIYAAYRDGAVHRVFTEVFWRKDGTSFPVEYASTPIYEQGRLAGAVVTFVDITERKRAEEALEEERRRLQKALDDVRTLRGIVPICASCKKIRDDKGYWNRVEVYVSGHTEAEFSHGICPECMKKLYPGFAEDESGAKP